MEYEDYDFCSCEGEPVEFYNDKEVKASKEHTCGECKETINKGDTYQKMTYRFEGEWYSYKICEFCWHDYKILQKAYYCVNIGDGQGDLAKAWEHYWKKTA